MEAANLWQGALWMGQLSVVVNVLNLGFYGRNGALFCLLSRRRLFNHQYPRLHNFCLFSRIASGRNKRNKCLIYGRV